MLLLAIEQSSQNCGLAVLEGEKVIAARKWDGFILRSAGLFSSLKDLSAKNSVSLDCIACYVVDIGPGSYSGLRSSLAAVQSFALPRKQKIYALTSAEVIAFKAMSEFSADKVQVIGDARRRQWWSCVYKNSGRLPSAEQKIGLMPENEFKHSPDALVVSPDWDRLKDSLTAMAVKGARIIETPCLPAADDLGRLAYRKICADIPGEPLAPIYLHAAVADAKR